MASHKVGSIPGGRLGDAERPNAAQSIVTGSYGLSVRVQGIDGQPFVVLNKQSAECLNHGEPTGNGVPNSSFLDSYDEYDFRGLGGASHTDDPFAEYRSQKQMQKTLLNFQMYPELLMPYDPENNTLSLERCHAPRRRPASLAEPGDVYRCSLPRATSPLLPRTRSPGSPDAAAHLDEDRLQPSPAREVSRTFPTRSLSTASSSSSSSLERGRHEPDVLPLRRHGSSGPVLQLPPSCGTTRPPCTYLQEALYADTINRHENRRYIPFLPGTGRDIDTGSIPSVDELISKFDSRDGQQRRGRAGRRNRIGAEERKRSRSVDSALPFGPRGKADWPDRVSKISSGECRLLPSESKHRNGVPPSDPENSETPRSPVSVRGNVGTGASSQDSSGSTSPQGSVSVAKTSLLSSRKLLSKSSTTLAEVGGGDGETSSRTVKVLTSMATTSLSKAPVENHKKTSAERNVQVTPDLLKGQQELSQQTNEETAKQILFNYLKDGSSDNDDTTKRKVNLVFEKIQTLKSRAARNTQSADTTAELRELRELQTQKEMLERSAAELRKQLEEETEKLVAMVAAQDKAAADRENMQTELAKSQQESAELREQLSRAEEELRKTTEELRQVKTERDQSQTEVKDLQEQLSEMHDELDGAKRAVIDSGVKDAMLEDLLLMKLDFQEVLQSKEDQDEVLRRRERELIALKGALKEEVATHDKEVDTLRARYEQEVHKLQVALQEAKRRNATTSQEKAAVEAARAEVEARAEHLVQEGERLRKRERELENAIAELNRVIDEAKLKESLLGDRVTRLEKEKEQLEESIVEAKGQEEELTRANTALTTQLEDIQKDLTKVTQQHKELSDQLREERIQKEQLKKAKNQVDDERQFLSRTVEKLRKEMCHLAEASQTATSELQAQMDEQQERKRREFAELQRQLRDKAAELEQSREALDRLQEKLSRLEEDLRQCKEEREGAELRGQSLEQQVHDLELEMEAKSRSKEDRSRRIKLLEDRISQLELDLEEERSNGDLLMDRLERGKEQIEQIRNDLLQERAAKQELECDKMTLERQNKELKSRVARLECSQESSKGSMVSQLEDRIQELEEKLQGESRDRANLQLANRRLERKVKEMMIHVDDEHKSLQDQKDQLNLRLKTLKRQMDEAEEEIERLEHGKKKLQRDLEEQMEQNEELQSQIKALRNEMRRKSTSAPILNDDLDDDDDDDDDDMSTDGDTYYHSASGNK
ncbi:cingulin-like protein 1 [Scleropages formosus]|uniref:Cingulin like 1 n=1 Tax=Scleropages formosus TaxID=113540 RepID=A0A8C9SE18_SCLFO|nr:cingulin-like protein 1 [Scleropages formosus]